MTSLTARERDVLRLLALGEDYKTTARTLHIAAHTVKKYRSRLYAKLGARNGAHAVSIGHGLGLLPGEGGGRTSTM